MGYITYHTLTIEPENEDLLREIWGKECNKENSGYVYALSADGSVADSCKWYDHDEDMRRISKEYPDTLFHLHGEGEECGDIWDATYKNGLCHHRQAEIEIDPFDPGKLE